jgi:hypothetical protein
MKTIGYMDRADQRKRIFAYMPKQGQNKNDRIADAIKELKTVGEIQVFFLKGKKQRLLFDKKN